MPSLLDLYEAIKPKYIIFCDMDGVLVDFDKGYKNLTGIATHHADAQGKDEFWNIFQQSLKEKGISEYKYWINLDWQPGGKNLWGYIKKYNPYILTAPSHNLESREAKSDWTQRLDGVKKVYFKPAKSKSDFSRKNRILIDDRKDTIDRWNAAGGIGILHTSPENTIKQLQDLGL